MKQRKAVSKVKKINYKALLGFANTKKKKKLFFTVILCSIAQLVKEKVFTFPNASSRWHGLKFFTKFFLHLPHISWWEWGKIGEIEKKNDFQAGYTKGWKVFRWIYRPNLLTFNKECMWFGYEALIIGFIDTVWDERCILSGSIL